MLADKSLSDSCWNRLRPHGRHDERGHILAWIWARAMRTSNPSTIITKLLSTPTGHCGTSSIPLHPVLALRTLLKLSPLCELYEGFIIFVETVIDTVLLTWHPHVVIAAASQTIVLFTGRTTVVIQYLVELKDGLTSCGRTPWSTGIILLDKLIEGEFLVFLSQLAVNITEYLACI